jgi:uncharacterized protein with von Willebrand factor type A (vWA) domain
VLFLDALRSVVGWESPERLKSICRLLWAKSREDQERFDDAFERLVEPQLQPRQTSKPRPRPGKPGGGEASTGGPQGGETSIRPTTQGSRWTLDPGELEARIAPISPLAGTGLSEAGPASAGIYEWTPRLPISLREMTSRWRHLRRLRRDGPAVELDIPATLAAIGRAGVFLRPVLRPRRRNQVRLLLLLDRRGSMVPFQPLVDTLVQSIRRSGLSDRLTCFYFHNTPAKHVYAQPGLTDRRPLQDVRSQFARGNEVVIVSDAGAARRSFRSSRVTDTRTFLDGLRQQTFLIAWLNPVPRERWEGTTAEDVARLVPMFPLDSEGLIDTVNVLCGRPYRAGKGSNDGA